MFVVFIVICGFPSISALQNLALGKAAFQTDVHHSGGTADNAVDGNTDGYYNQGSCMHTASTMGAWWEVDLGQVYRIDHVNIFSRTDCCTNSLRDVELYIGYSNDNYVLRVFHPGNLWPSSTFQLSSPVLGRWVKITRHLSVVDYALVMCEVQVFGDEIDLPIIRFEYGEGKIGTGAVLESTQARTKTECCLQCKNTDRCLAVNYNSVSKMCDKLETVAAMDNSDANINFYRYP